MQYFKIVIAYDGTDFHGWQTQPNGIITVSLCMQKAFYKAFKKKVSLVGASRTDAGVHALGQVVKFQTDLNIDSQVILNAWNSILPRSILIKEIKKISNDFHPCKNVLQKTYEYNLFLTRPLPLDSRYGWFCRYIDKVDINQFEQCLKLYVGKHDFTSFCKIEPGEDKDPIRTIDSIELIKDIDNNRLQVIIKGKGFLRFQIRRMIGYALDVARRDDLSVNYLKDVLDKPCSQQKLLKAEGCGLTLRKIDYKDV